MMSVKFFFSAKLKLISDNWEFISANALSLLRVTGADPRVTGKYASCAQVDLIDV